MGLLFYNITSAKPFLENPHAFPNQIYYRTVSRDEMMYGMSFDDRWPFGHSLPNIDTFKKSCLVHKEGSTVQGMRDDKKYYALCSDSTMMQVASQIQPYLICFLSRKPVWFDLENIINLILNGKIRYIRKNGKELLVYLSTSGMKAFKKLEILSSIISLPIEGVMIIEPGENCRVFEINPGGHAEFCEAFPHGSWVGHSNTSTALPNTGMSTGIQALIERFGLPRDAEAEESDLLRPLIAQYNASNTI